MSTIREQRQKAEQELGIDECYKVANAARLSLADAVASLVSLRKKRRELESALEQREADVTQETWASNSDMPVTRLDKLVKVEIAKDQMIRGVKANLDELAFEIDQQESYKTVAEAELRVQCARMNELQGYLQFTAALMAVNRATNP